MEEAPGEADLRRPDPEQALCSHGCTRPTLLPLSQAEAQWERKVFYG